RPGHKSAHAKTRLGSVWKARGPQTESVRWLQGIDFSVQSKKGSLLLQEVKHGIKNRLRCSAGKVNSGRFALPVFVGDFVRFRMLEVLPIQGNKERQARGRQFPSTNNSLHRIVGEAQVAQAARQLARRQLLLEGRLRLANDPD